MMGSGIRRALVLAAGRGTRISAGHFREAPKPLRMVAGRPLLAHVARALSRVGVVEMVVVVGHRAEELQAALPRWLPDAMRVRYVANPRYASSDNGVSVLAAAAHVDEPCLLTMADHLFGADLLRVVLTGAGCALAVDRDPSRCFDLSDATKVRLEGNFVRAVGKNLVAYDALDTGVFRITPRFVEALAATFRRRGNCSVSDGVQALADLGAMRASDAAGAWWLDVDTPEALELAAACVRGGAMVGT